MILLTRYMVVKYMEYSTMSKIQNKHVPSLAPSSLYVGMSLKHDQNNQSTQSMVVGLDVEWEGGKKGVRQLPYILKGNAPFDIW